MKTQIQYPGGLAIIIEHEEQIVPQLLEVKECVSSDDPAILKSIELAAKNESLERTAREFETLCEKLEKENSGLRTALENVKILNNDNLATISALREELKSVYEKPAPATPTKAEKVEKTKRKKVPVPSEKANPVWSKKPCANCGHLFQPTGPRSSVCPDCKAAAEVFAAGNEFTENPE